MALKYVDVNSDFKKEDFLFSSSSSNLKVSKSQRCFFYFNLKVTVLTLSCSTAI